MSTDEDETQWLDDDERGAWLALAALVTKLPGALDSQLQADAGLSFFEYMVLVALSEQPGRTLQMTEIAEFASASLSRLSHTAKRLEQQGLITREQVPGHGRRTRATLTDAGYDKVVATAPGHVTHVRHLIFDGLTDRDVADLTRIGEHVLRRMDADACR